MAGAGPLMGTSEMDFAPYGPSGSSVSTRMVVRRGMSFADYDHDGRVDVLLCDLEGRAVLLHNVTEPRHHWLDVRLQSNGPNRFGLGARVTLRAAGLSQLREIRTSGSVLSGLDPVAHFGLGDSVGSAEVEVRWPNGRIQKASVAHTDRTLTLTAP